MKTMPWLKRLCAVTVSLLLACPASSIASLMGTSVTTSAGNITIDGSTHTGIDRAQNNVPVVNIAAPTAAGVSQNHFSDFNVGTEGAIMNNSNQMAVSKLGGALYANPNLSPNQAARIILNEVTSTRASNLLGATEIFGQSANYVLANPNGITCNGCGFINTPRVTLGTGRSVMQNGDFLGLNIDPAGSINVAGQGLLAGAVDFVDVVSRMIHINAAMYAKSLNLQTGNGYYDASTGQASSTAASGAPALSVDSSLLGGIYAGQITLESTEKGVGVNMGGPLASQGDLHVSADGQIDYVDAASQQGTLSIRSENAGITQHGFASAQGDVQLNAMGPILLNNDPDQPNGTGIAGGSIEIATRGTDPSDGIQNQVTLASQGEAVFSTGQTFTNNGSIGAANIQINAGDFLNSAAGICQSSGNLGLTTTQDINLMGGSLTASQNLLLNALGNIQTNAVLHADGEATLTTGQTFTNNGSIAAANIQINADDFSNSATGMCQSSGNLAVTTTHDINLTGGSLTASQNLTLNALGNIQTDAVLHADGQAALTAGNQVAYQNTISAGTADQTGNPATGISIHADSIMGSPGATLASYGSLNLRANQDLTLVGALSSYGDMTIAGNGNIYNQTDLNVGNNLSLTAGLNFQNGYLVAGKSILTQILANGNGVVQANTITNYGSLETGGDLTLSATNALINDRENSNAGLAGNALILSNGKLNLYADQITNHAGEILSVGDIAIQKDAAGDDSTLVQNLSDAVGANTSSAVIESNGTISIHSAALNNLSYDYDPDLNPNDPYGYSVVTENVGGWGNNQYSLMTQQVAVSTLMSQPSFITAGGNLSMTDANIWNRSSSLSAGQDLTVTNGSLDNEYTHVTATNLASVYGEDLKWKTCGGFFNICHHHESFNTITDYTNATVYSNIAPTVYATGNVVINGVASVANGSAAPMTAKVYNSANLTAVQNSGIIPIIGISNPATALQTDLNLSALFSVSQNPNSGYLIETNGLFTNINTLEGSQYFLSRIGYVPNTDVLLLGDDYFQAELVEQSILQATGKPSVEIGTPTLLDQLDTLYDNAYEETQDLQLTPGIALTKNQISHLKKDIVWLVEEVIDVNGKPQKVLEPQVYLCTATLQTLENPLAGVDGNNLSIQSSGNITNGGEMSALDQVVLGSQRDVLIVDGNVKSGGNTSISSGGNVINQGGNISAGNNLTVQAGGSIASSNIDTRVGIANNWSDQMGAGNSMESAGSTSLSAGADISLTGTTLSAGSDLSLAAGQNVNIAADQLNSATQSVTSGKHYSSNQKTSAVTNQLASVTSGGNMSVTAGKDLNVIGGNLASQGTMALSSQNNLTIASVQNQAAAHTASSSQSRSSEQDSQSIRNQLSTLNSGGDMTISSGQDVAIVGGNLTSQGNISINSAGALTIASVQDEDSSYSQDSKKGFFSSKESIQAGDQTTQVASQISSGNDMGVDGDKSILVSASKLNSGGDMSLASSGDITLASAADTQSTYDFHQKLSFAGFSIDFNRSSVDFNVSQTGTSDEKTTNQTTQKPTDLQSNGNLNITSGQNTVAQSSNLTSGQNTAINAGGDVDFLTAQDTQDDSEKISTLKNTFTETIGNSWVESAFTASDAAQTLDKSITADNASSAPGAVNAAVAAANAAVAAFEVAKVAQSAADSTDSASTLGFYGSYSMTQEHDSQTSSSAQSSAVGSNVLATNLRVSAQNNIQAKAAQLEADGGDLNLTAGNAIQVESGQTSQTQAETQDSQSLRTVLVSSNGDFIPQLSLSQSQAKNTEVSQNNAFLSATQGTVTLVSGGNTDLLGANVLGKNVDMTGIGGDLTLASRQDTMESDSSNYSIDLGMQRIGFSIGGSQANESWTNSPSSIIGTQSVNIKVQDLNMEGSLIANQNANGADGGNLSIDVARLNATNLADTSKSSSYSFGIGTTLSSSIDDAGKTSFSLANGSSNIGFANAGQDKEGITYATIGQGQVIIGGDASGAGDINRNLSSSQVVTENKTTGGYNFNLQLPNQVIVDLANDVQKTVEKIGESPAKPVETTAPPSAPTEDTPSQSTTVSATPAPPTLELAFAADEQAEDQSEQATKDMEKPILQDVQFPPYSPAMDSYNYNNAPTFTISPETSQLLNTLTDGIVKDEEWQDRSMYGQYPYLTQKTNPNPSLNIWGHQIDLGTTGNKAAQAAVEAPVIAEGLALGNIVVNLVPPLGIPYDFGVGVFILNGILSNGADAQMLLTNKDLFGNTPTDEEFSGALGSVVGGGVSSIHDTIKLTKDVAGWSSALSDLSFTPELQTTVMERISGMDEYAGAESADFSPLKSIKPAALSAPAQPAGYIPDLTYPTEPLALPAPPAPAGYLPYYPIIPLNATPVYGVSLERMRMGDPGTLAVIGRNQDDRVIPMAGALGAETFKPTDEALALHNNGDSSLLLRENIDWATKLNNENYTVFDVGLEPKFKADGNYGKFYSEEVERIFRNNYKTIF